MAEDQDLLEELDAADAEPAGKPPIVKILLIVLGLAVLGGGGYFAYENFIKEKPVEEAPDAAKEREAVDEEAADLGVMFPMDPFIVNLAGSGGKRFLKITISLELSAPEVHVEIKENIQKITDSILVLLSSKTFEDVYTAEGKEALRSEITNAVNSRLTDLHVIHIYFTEFVVKQSSGTICQKYDKH